jgi:methylisocitrate lyase
MENQNRNAALKAIFNQNRTIVAPGTYDALSAKLVEEAGFDIIYIGSYGTAASGYGFADVGLLSLDACENRGRRSEGSGYRGCRRGIP